MLVAICGSSFGQIFGQSLEIRFQHSGHHSTCGGELLADFDWEGDFAKRYLAPRAGFEPATDRLTVDCSTTELPGNLYHRQRSASDLRSLQSTAADRKHYSTRIGYYFATQNSNPRNQDRPHRAGNCAGHRRHTRILTDSRILDDPTGSGHSVTGFCKRKTLAPESDGQSQPLVGTPKGKTIFLKCVSTRKSWFISLTVAHDLARPTQRQQGNRTQWQIAG